VRQEEQRAASRALGGKGDAVFLGWPDGELESGLRQRWEVAYWIRIGALYSESAVDTRRHILLEGLRGRVPDGVLVRASRVIAHPADAAAAYPSLERFLEELTAAVAPSRRSVLVQ